MFGVECLPEFEKRQEIGSLVAEARVSGVCLLGGIEWPLADILYAQGGSNDQNLVEHVFFLGLQDHPAEVWVGG